MAKLKELDKFYDLYLDGRLQHKAPHSYIDYFKARKFLLDEIDKIREKHAKDINRILNLHSRSLSEGGMDYVKAFEEMEKYESKLFKQLEKKA